MTAAELFVTQYYQQKGWSVHNNGGTIDLIITRKKQFKLIEVKTGSDRLSDKQLAVLTAAEIAGVRAAVALVFCQTFPWEHRRNSLSDYRNGSVCPACRVFEFPVSSIRKKSFDTVKCNLKLAKAIGRLLRIPAYEYESAASEISYNYRPEQVES